MIPENAIVFDVPEKAEKFRRENPYAKGTTVVKHGYKKFTLEKDGKALTLERKEDDVADFPIYFNDLNDDAKKRLLEFVKADHPSDMNWDINMCPLAYYPAPSIDD